MDEEKKIIYKMEEDFTPHFGNLKPIFIKYINIQIFFGPYICFFIFYSLLEIIVYSLFYKYIIYYQNYKINLGFFIVISFEIFFRIRLHTRNPGIAALNHKNFYNKGQFCIPCKIYRNNNIEHCLNCDVCIEGFDHHCVVLGACVGKNNLYDFYLFITSFIFVYIFSIAICFYNLI